MIKIGETYEKEAIGQVLAELAKGKKWKKCMVDITTQCQAGGYLVYSSMKIVKFKRSGTSFDLCVMSKQIGLSSCDQRHFFWPGERDEDEGERKPIAELIIVGWERKKKRKRGKDEGRRQDKVRQKT